jgi:hypothetical protein
MVDIIDAYNIAYPRAWEETMSVIRAGSQARAQRLAREMLTGFDVGDLEWLVSQYLDYQTETEQLYKAVDPRYCNLEKEGFELFSTLETAMTV